MKPHLITHTVAVSLLLAARADVQALAPRPHLFNGVIEAIDSASPTITLKSRQNVQVWYRREAGQNVLRVVSTKGAPAGRGVFCE